MLGLFRRAKFLPTNQSPREMVIAAASKTGSVLEIGPFFSPCLVGQNVSYFDVLGKDDLVRRAESIGHDGKSVPHINYVSPTGDLSVVDRKFDAVLSAHCIEHQPDLIRHLVDVTKILTPDGKYFLIIPDKRYCFDAHLAASNIAEIIDAHLEGRSVHTLSSVIEHRALTTHNESAQHWAGHHGDNQPAVERAKRIRGAIDEWRAANGGYVDVHAWQFTPDSFFDIIAVLHELDLIELEVEFVLKTQADELEFGVVLRRR